MSVPFTPVTDSANISTTEYYLASDSTSATFQTTACKLVTILDLSDMIAGDELRIRVYEKVNGGTARPIHEVFVGGVQSEMLVLPMFWVHEGWEVSVIRTAGTDVVVAWALKKDVGDTNVLSWGSAAGAVNALIAGRVDASVGAMAANVITAAAIAADAITAAKVAADAVTKIADGIFAYVIEAGPANASTFIQRLRIWWSVFAAKASGLTIPADTTEHFRDAADTKDRASYTMAAAGTRTPGAFDGT